MNPKRPAITAIFCILQVLLSCAVTVLANTDSGSSNNSEDPMQECELFLAESSIPNSGWGIYTGKDLKKDESSASSSSIHPPDLAIQAVDFVDHMLLRYKLTREVLPQWKMADYVWHASTTFADNDAKRVDSVIPGLGMAANSHPGLNNLINLGPQRIQGEGNNGAYTRYQQQAFQARYDLPAGHELFTDYGDTWFAGRADQFGDHMPLSTHYTAADNIVLRYENLSKGGNASFAHDLWDMVAQNITPTISPRLYRALPKTMEKAADRTSPLNKTAYESVPNAVRPLPWLQEHGFCLDHIQPKPSTTPSAGMGAFAKRFLRQGTVVVATPVVPISKAHLEMILPLSQGHRKLILDDDNDHEPVWKGYQLLLNYVYGHPSTSLVFFPYAPVVNMINHKGQEEANVKLQWSTVDAPVFNQTAHELLQKPKTLLMEIVAIKDIAPGQEVVLDYGDAWQKAWDTHDHFEPSPDFVSAWTFQQETPFRTEADDDTSYPPYIEVFCLIDFDTDTGISEQTETGRKQNVYQWRRNGEMTFSAEADRCHLVNSNVGGDFYRVRLEREGVTTIIVENVPKEAIYILEKPYTGEQFQRNAFRHEIQLPDEMIPEIWMDQYEETCGLYMAESAIPNSGLGMYTAKEILQNGQIFYGDVVLQAEDHEVNMRLHHRHHKLATYEPDWLMENYYWNCRVTKATFEATEIESIVPGLGMLANSHTGLVNAVMKPPQVTNILRRDEHPGTGASTNYHNVRFVSNQNIEAGAELFVEYGDDWFKYRAEIIGLIPLSHDFEVADARLQKFWKLVNETADTGVARDLWDLVKNPAWRRNKEEARIQIALPERLDQVKDYVKDGCAKRSVENRVRSPEWLKENGRCLDNIRPAISTVKQAGRGAFTTRSIHQGAVITPAPVVHLHRRHMELWDSDDGDDPLEETWFEGHQLLLNYCFGHPKSSLLLFPYAPVVNYVNHNATGFNAELRWSNLPNHQADWLKRTPEDLMNDDHAGLIMELVATRDIAPGEEIFLNYGVSWEDAWTNFVDSWEPGDADYVPASDLNDWYDWIEPDAPESEDTFARCYYSRLKKDPLHKNVFIWRGDKDIYEDASYASTKYCEVIGREIPKDAYLRKGSTLPLDVTYTAKIYPKDKGGITFIMRGIPRRAVEFFDQGYTSDSFLQDVFRHEIELPDHMVPEAWRDLDDEIELPDHMVPEAWRDLDDEKEGNDEKKGNDEKEGNDEKKGNDEL
jgi:hypothetical protein